jgi:esterase
MRLHYRKEGEGPVVVIIHGLYGSSDNWMSIGKRLAENHTVYIPDQRNHGHSPLAGGHSYDDMKNDMAEFFDTHNIDRAILLGHSMGGKTAMWFAADYPERIQKLVIADIAPKDYLKMKERSQFKMHREILMTMKAIDFEKADSRSSVDKMMAGRIGDANIRKFLLKNLTKDRSTHKYRWRINVDVLLENLEEIVGGVNEKWFEDRMPIAGYPVIFIRGMKSNYILPEDEPLIKSIYPDAAIVDIPDSGHWLHVENPKKFMEAVLRCC